MRRATNTSPTYEGLLKERDSYREALADVREQRDLVLAERDGMIRALDARSRDAERASKITELREAVASTEVRGTGGGGEGGHGARISDGHAEPLPPIETQVAAMAARQAERRAVLAVALMLENHADALPIRTGADNETERGLRAEIEQLRGALGEIFDDENEAAAAFYERLANP